MNCLEVVFEGRYDFVLFYDHSSGNTKKRRGGLDVTDTNNNWGEGVMITALIEDKSYIGPYHDLKN